MSLIQPVPGHGDARFTMYRVVAEYAAERLAEAGEADAVARRHAAAMTALADQDLRHSVGEAQADRLDRLAAEHANLSAALEWLIARGDGEAALVLGADLWRYWYLRGHLREGRGLLARALACPTAAPTSEARARVANGLGVLAWLQGDFAAARAALEAARDLAASLGDDARVLRINHNLGIVAVDEGDFATAADLAEANLAIARRLGDRHAEAGVLHALGVVAAEQAESETARARFTEALAIQRAIDDREGAGASLINLAELCLLAGDLDGAETCLGEGEPLARAVADVWTLGTIQLKRGEIAIAAGRLPEARHALAAAARQRIAAGDRKGSHASCRRWPASRSRRATPAARRGCSAPPMRCAPGSARRCRRARRWPTTATSRRCAPPSMARRSTRPGRWGRRAAPRTPWPRCSASTSTPEPIPGAAAGSVPGPCRGMTRQDPHADGKTPPARGPIWADNGRSCAFGHKSRVGGGGQPCHLGRWVGGLGGQSRPQTT